jgi:hypothetical protein
MDGTLTIRDRFSDPKIHLIFLSAWGTIPSADISSSLDKAIDKSNARRYEEKDEKTLVSTLGAYGRRCKQE